MKGAATAMRSAARTPRRTARPATAMTTLPAIWPIEGRASPARRLLLGLRGGDPFEQIAAADVEPEQRAARWRRAISQA